MKVDSILVRPASSIGVILENESEEDAPLIPRGSLIVTTETGTTSGVTRQDDVESVIPGARAVQSATLKANACYLSCNVNHALAEISVNAHVSRRPFFRRR